jgi:hypothetical protein
MEINTCPSCKKTMREANITSSFAENGKEFILDFHCVACGELWSVEAIGTKLTNLGNTMDYLPEDLGCTFEL